MDTGLLIALLSLISGGAGVLISWLAFVKRSRRDSEKFAENKGFLASDIGYIKAGVDDLKREGRETRTDVRLLSERITRCEESCKQAHKRIDEMHEQIASLNKNLNLCISLLAKAVSGPATQNMFNDM